MLPRLKYLDEEEVEFIKEVGALYMPKYQAILRRIKQEKITEQQQVHRPGSRSPHQASTAQTKGTKPARRRESPGILSSTEAATELKTEDDHEQSADDAVEANESEHVDDVAESKPSGAAVPGAADVPASLQSRQVQRIVVKDSSTNTELDWEKEMLRREQQALEKEQATLEKEKAMLTKENEVSVKEKQLLGQVKTLQDELKSALARSDHAEAAMKEISERALRAESTVKELREASSSSATSQKEMQKSAHEEWESAMKALREAHQIEIIKHKATETELITKMEKLSSDTNQLTDRLQKANDDLREKEQELSRREKEQRELEVSIELIKREKLSDAHQFSGDMEAISRRHKEAEERSRQLEQDVKELQGNLKAVYNKCIEKDDAIHQLNKALLSKIEDIDTMKRQQSKFNDRQEKLLHQQQELYEKQLKASILQIEMEFRKEHTDLLQKRQTQQRKYHEAVRENARFKDMYENCIKREAEANEEIQRLQATLMDDKKKLFMLDAKKLDDYEMKIHNLFEQNNRLQQELERIRGRNEEMLKVNERLKEVQKAHDALETELTQWKQQQSVWKKQEDDLKAALKVKDVMLDDQLRQIEELRKRLKDDEEQFQDEMMEMQTQLNDLEAALDEHIQRLMDEKAKSKALSESIAEKELIIATQDQEIQSLKEKLDQKHAALEFIEKEMDQMRLALSAQDGLFKRRMEKHLEQHREALERVRSSAEDAIERQRIEWDAKKQEMVADYSDLVSKLKQVTSENTKLRIDLEAERRQTTQNDQDMRVLLAQVWAPSVASSCLWSSSCLSCACLQIDRERHVKKESLKHIKSLFEQLQQTSP